MVLAGNVGEEAAVSRQLVRKDDVATFFQLRPEVIGFAASATRSDLPRP